MALARVRFADLKRVKISDNRGFLELLIAGRYVIRFKKLRKDRRSSNIPTRQQIDWFSVQLELPDMPPAAVRLIAGYQLDVLGTDVENILLTRPVGSLVEWSFSISSTSTGRSNIVAFPKSGDKPKPATPRSTKPKKEEEDKGSE